MSNVLGKLVVLRLCLVPVPQSRTVRYLVLSLASQPTSAPCGSGLARETISSYACLVPVPVIEMGMNLSKLWV